MSAAPWPPARRALAPLAVLAALATSAAGVALGHGDWVLLAAATHVVAAVAAVASPPAVVAQIAAGLALSWGTLPGTDVPTPAVIPVVAGTVATAEVLGAVARLGSVVARDPLPLLGRAAGATALATVTAAVAVAAAGFRGPGGLAATLVAAAACLAVLTLATGDGATATGPAQSGGGSGS